MKQLNALYNTYTREKQHRMEPSRPEREDLVRFLKAHFNGDDYLQVEILLNEFEACITYQGFLSGAQCIYELGRELQFPSAHF